MNINIKEVIVPTRKWYYVVLGENTRSFGAVYQVAQKILENTFGMELVELMSRAERERDKDEPEEEGEKNGTGLKKKGILSKKGWNFLYCTETRA